MPGASNQKPFDLVKYLKIKGFSQRNPSSLLICEESRTFARQNHSRSPVAIETLMQLVDPGKLTHMGPC